MHPKDFKLKVEDVPVEPGERTQTFKISRQDGLDNDSHLISFVIPEFNIQTKEIVSIGIIIPGKDIERRQKTIAHAIKLLEAAGIKTKDIKKGEEDRALTISNSDHPHGLEIKDRNLVIKVVAALSAPHGNDITNVMDEAHAKEIAVRELDRQEKAGMLSSQSGLLKIDVLKGKKAPHRMNVKIVYPFSDVVGLSEIKREIHDAEGASITVMDTSIDLKKGCSEATRNAVTGILKNAGIVTQTGVKAASIEPIILAPVASADEVATILGDAGVIPKPFAKEVSAVAEDKAHPGLAAFSTEARPEVLADWAKRKIAPAADALNPYDIKKWETDLAFVRARDELIKKGGKT